MRIEMLLNKLINEHKKKYIHALVFLDTRNLESIINKNQKMILHPSYVFFICAVKTEL